jgi:hypothetical protein
METQWITNLSELKVEITRLLSIIKSKNKSKN